MSHEGITELFLSFCIFQGSLNSPQGSYFHALALDSTDYVYIWLHKLVYMACMLITINTTHGTVRWLWEAPHTFQMETYIFLKFILVWSVLFADKHDHFKTS